MTFQLASFKALSRLSLPIVLSMASSVLIALVDTAMVSPLGEVPLAAVGLTATVVMLFYATLYGWVSMAGVDMANAFGAQDDQRLSGSLMIGGLANFAMGAVGALVMALCYGLLPYFGQPEEVVQAALPYFMGIALSLIPFSLFYTLKGFFDAIDRAWLGLWVGLATLGSNIPLNYLFIYTLDYGITGAAIATCLSYLVGIGLTIYLVRDRLVWPSNVFSRSLNLIGQGTPVALGFAGEAGAFVTVGLMVGLFGPAALAANQIANAMGSVLYMVPLGVSIAISMLAGQAMGREAPTEARSLTLHAVVMSAGWMAICAVILVISADQIALWFAPTAAVQALAGGLLVVHAIMQMGDGIQSAALGGLRGMGDTQWPVGVTLTSYACIGVPGAWLLSQHTPLGIYGLWVGYGMGLYIVGAVLTWRVLRGRTPSIPRTGAHT